ncbi:MAG: aminotransferase class I/II-fold pyridoxal phosphate-dependent enzyme [Oscillospiraceae bacterium]|nr:aminotransferase class I/II-fold pyridoxal phosphate-dependent enzyme [Oscillospiraceae bacterium]
MSRYSELESGQLASLLDELMEEYRAAKERKLNLNMSRGVPEKAQLDLSTRLLTAINAASSLSAEDGMDCRNYGALDGIPEARRLMAQMLELEPEQVFVGGNASLSLMHDCLTFAFLHGLPESPKPWAKEEKIKFICPVPGYDRHFAMTEHFGCELIAVPMTLEGPDIGAVTEAVKDPAVKGIWCVPKYSNPQGITYSDAVVRALAALSPAAPDFRIFWDNAYTVHALDMDHQDSLLNIMTALEKLGKQDRVFMFTSTSKVTFPGAGISAVGMSKANLDWFKGHKFYQTIGNDKINQLRHARFLPDMDSVMNHMRKHADIVRPKFQAVLDALAPLGEEGIAQWDVPRGGYFISLNVMPGCAKRVIQLCREAGVTLTPAGSTHPYGIDPEDKNIRIAPTSPPIEELHQAADLLCLCVRIASAEKLGGAAALAPAQVAYGDRN